MPASRRSSLAVVAVVAFAIVVTFAGLFGAGAFSVGGFGRTPSTEPAPTSPFSKYVASGDKVLSEALSAVHVRLPTRQGAPAPDLPARAFSGIRPHVVVGFLPSYELAKLKSAVLSDYSTIVFSSIGILGNGGLDHSSDGWLRLRQGEVAPLLSGAHRAGTEVLLGLSATSNSVIDALTASPVASAGRLLAAVSPLLAQGFDGVDLDVEGQSGAGRAGYSTFVSVFSKALHARKATWQLMVNTYPQSAVDSEGFYDVEALAPAVNEFFVMAYDMSDLAVPSATAPLTGADLSDVSVVSSYAAGGFAAKSILGVPFYGYDFPASRGHPPAVTAGTPFAVTYDSIVAAGHAQLWDPVTDTAFSSFRRGRTWHQTWFDDPVSIALKTALASRYGFLGVGAWEIGMATSEPSMTAALAGGAPVVRLPPASA